MDDLLLRGYPIDARPPLQNPDLFDHIINSVYDAGVTAEDVTAVLKMLNRSRYHYEDGKGRLSTSRVTAMCESGLKLKAIMNLRRVCKPWANILKNDLDAVQSIIRSMDADVVVYYAIAMLEMYSLKPIWVPYNEYHPPSKHLLGGSTPLLLVWIDPTPFWSGLSLKSLKRMGDEAHARNTPGRCQPAVFEIIVDRNIPDHPYMAASAARRGTSNTPGRC